jgi:hypothetical protein
MIEGPASAVPFEPPRSEMASAPKLSRTMRRKRSSVELRT